MSKSKPVSEATSSTAPLLAFKTSAIGTTSIVWARTRGKARWATVQSATEAGYQVGMTDVQCKRHPALDEAKQADGRPIKENNCYKEDLLYR